jgi:glycosyltransferase involved in cell wall biosynthesis
MGNVRAIVILYPGETSSRRVNEPGNYSLSRLLIQLEKRRDLPIYFLNQTAEHEQWGRIEFIHFTALNFLKLLVRLAGRRNVLIINQTKVYVWHSKLLRAVLPGSRVLVRLGGVYNGRAYFESGAFERTRRANRRRFSVADMIISTADGTPVDLFMERIGVAPERYRSWPNGFPVIENHHNCRRRNRIICISRLSHEKAIDYVVRSFALALPRLVEPHTLGIVGDGPELEPLRALARELGVATSVEFCGESYDIGPHLYSSRLLVSGLANNTVMEAIATGTTVIALDLGEMRKLYGRFPNVYVVDYPPGGYGRIAPMYMDRVVRATADMIVAVLNNYSTVEPRASKRACEKFSWEQRLDAELRLYEELFTPAKAK